MKWPRVISYKSSNNKDQNDKATRFVLGSARADRLRRHAGPRHFVEQLQQQFVIQQLFKQLQQLIVQLQQLVKQLQQLVIQQ